MSGTATQISARRAAALDLMDGRGPILDVAREVSELLASAGIPAAVIGGVAVVLHGHWRSTRDVDVLVSPPLDRVAEVLTSHGYELHADRGEFERAGTPVHLVLPDQTGLARVRTVDIEGIRTVPLEDLIGMKLRSGTRDMLRAQDLADVIGLIRRVGLGSEFARHLDKELRPAFRKLVRAIRQTP